MQIEAGVITRDSEVWVKFYMEGSIPLVSPEVVFIFEGVHHFYDVQVQPQVPAAANSGRLVYQYKTSLQRMPWITNYSTILVHVQVKLYA